jgi:tetratricopeptide (TPR) repeat protein
VADGRRLCIRRDDRLLGPGGQMQLAFYADDLLAQPAAAEPAAATVPLSGSPRRSRPPQPRAAEAAAVSLRLSGPAPDWLDDTEGGAGMIPGRQPTVGTELVALAADLEADGAIEEAAEALRAALQAEGPSAAITFMLAELLYRAGDLTAARERYYAAVELDADHLEARASLGCVLAELGEQELAIAALEGVLRQQPDYADAHWHLAGVLAGVGRAAESRQHLRAFLRLAPESPWADAARDRLAAHDRG